MPQDTRAILIETAVKQIRRTGYSAFSYADLAASVGIRKASIHHHFPAKEDLGVAIVAAYSEDLSDALHRIESQFPSPLDRIAAFIDIYRGALRSGLGCLCGVMAAELQSLPDALQASVRQYFKMNLRWLEKTLSDRGGGLRADVDPDVQARTVLATMQGALSVARATKDRKLFEQAAAGLLAGLTAV